MTNFSTVTNIEEKLGISELQIGPNPVADQLYVRFELEEVDSLMWRVINKSGMLMAQSSFQQMSVGRQEIEVSLKNLANGIYHLQLLNEQGQKRSAAFIKAE
jgi:hypothetical protein